MWSSEIKNNCYIETKSLDGETNLKTKIVKREIVKILGPGKIDVYYCFNKLISIFLQSLINQINKSFWDMKDLVNIYIDLKVNTK